MTRNARGFSLLELVVAITLSTIVMGVSVQAILATMSTYRTQEVRQEVDDEAKMLLDSMISELQGIGGGAARPWAVLRVNNGLSGASDELVIIVPDDTLGECAAIDDPGTNIKVDDASGCCLTAAWNNKPFIVISADGSKFSSRQATNVNTSSCQIQSNPGQGANPNPSDLDDITPGTVVSGKLVKYFVDTTVGSLMWWDSSIHDTNTDGLVDSGEAKVLADRVFDLQFALGYDSVLADGVITESSTPSNDEWMFNQAADNPDSGWTGSHADLRMVWVGLTTGAPAAPSAGPRSKVPGQLNGAQIEKVGYHLRQVSGKAYLRNLFFFNQ